MQTLALPALAAALLLAALPVQAQDPALPPTFGEVSLVSNFQPDPHRTTLAAGGTIRGEYTDANTGNRCAGYFADAPDLRLQFTTADFGFPLSVYVEARADTVMLINAPDGSWHCNDDTVDLNPALHFETPLEGQYDIWVGTYEDVAPNYPTADVFITELGMPERNFDRAFFGNDDRVVIDAATAPWNMIGFVDLSAASCTGTLIGPATVLTSAHCIIQDGEVDTPPVEFLAGFQNGAHVARSGVTGFYAAEGYINGEQEGTDYAFIYLEEPLGEQLGWMDIAPLTADQIAEMMQGRGPAIMQAGYSYDQQGVLTGNLSCPLIEVAPENVLEHECDTLQGDSGSPLFIENGNRFQIIGVESRTDDQPEEPFDRNVAMYVDYILADLARLEAGGDVMTPMPDTPEAK
ncbi:trypsin-like serine peptidase [Gymnodinialimonas ceratoperidinii]|uniref:Trypsin-like serine protease n=1 Tax=Gymnodinialimonas ceratoperidinii TaxID=2856823 RepID=A0A8F6TUK5_9RHOB|nr:trypsin-like serine protease [Gymnodinialimonas ceratoperidinii]QXT39252.1 trypsin-like serine protease [Gymnodinialimonas ceratoperidinii]